MSLGYAGVRVCRLALPSFSSAPPHGGCVCCAKVEPLCIRLACSSYRRIAGLSWAASVWCAYQPDRCSSILLKTGMCTVKASRWQQACLRKARI